MTAKQTPRSVKARKMVVLSAGANGTPLILERSGVGQKEILEKAGVPLVEELDGVGHDYQDHHLTLYAYRTNLNKRDTINAFSDGRIDVAQAIKDTDELLGTNAMDACESHEIYLDRTVTDDSLQLVSSDQQKRRSMLLVQSSVQHGTAISKTPRTDLS
jgi:choline dehydrogenase-like flavoprotein